MDAVPDSAKQAGQWRTAGSVQIRRETVAPAGNLGAGGTVQDMRYTAAQAVHLGAVGGRRDAEAQAATIGVRRTVREGQDIGSQTVNTATGSMLGQRQEYENPAVHRAARGTLWYRQDTPEQAGNREAGGTASNRQDKNVREAPGLEGGSVLGDMPIHAVEKPPESVEGRALNPGTRGVVSLGAALASSLAAVPPPGSQAQEPPVGLPSSHNASQTSAVISGAADYVPVDIPQPEFRTTAAHLNPQAADDIDDKSLPAADHNDVTPLVAADINDNDLALAGARRGEDIEFGVMSHEGVAPASPAALVEGEAGAESEAVGRRRVKPETLAFRAAFREAAVAAAQAAAGDDLGEGEQRTQQWMMLRETRLTASAFGNALG
jgi:hypothetical protein